MPDAAKERRSPSAATAAKPAPALTPAEAREAITNYSTTNNLAHSAKDRALLDTVEGGPRYAMSLADLKEDEGLPKADQRPFRAWSYDVTKTDLYIPRLAPGQQKWFAAVTRAGSGQQYARVLVLAENTKTKKWEMVSTVDIDDPQQLPQIVLDQDGYATPVDPASTELAAPVDLMRAAVGDNFATGGKQTGRKVFAPTKASAQQIKVHRTVNKFGTRGTTRFTVEKPEYPDAYALKTTTGALVVFSHTHAQHDASTTPGLRIVPEKHDRAWLGTSPSPAFTYRFTCSDVAAVPSTPDPSTLLGYGCRRTNAEATGTSTTV
ncbi:hypothetical protein ACFRQM_19005 [Streptomyces sp. NPDC056831]|uniref:hypothetical protein n=1 Tax=Streptomyces sp. NPDC056831 TaxID=3345954 RepID=UPI0036C0A8AF